MDFFDKVFLFSAGLHEGGKLRGADAAWKVGWPCTGLGVPTSAVVPFDGSSPFLLCACLPRGFDSGGEEKSSTALIASTNQHPSPNTCTRTLYSLRRRQASPLGCPPSNRPACRRPSKPSPPTTQALPHPPRGLSVSLPGLLSVLRRRRRRRCCCCAHLGLPVSGDGVAEPLLSPRKLPTSDLTS
jgi:hypothetical protein